MKFITAILLALNITTAPVDAGYKNVIHNRGFLTAPVSRDVFRKAEGDYKIPRGLLVAVGYEESRFRRDVISCKLSSAAGAKGIMQIIPRWHPGVDPCKVGEAVPYAGKYLSYLSKRYEGDWGLALAAYNWGLGNVDKFLQGKKGMPPTVQRYVYRVMINSGMVLVQHKIRDSPGGNMVFAKGIYTYERVVRARLSRLHHEIRIFAELPRCEEEPLVRVEHDPALDLWQCTEITDQMFANSLLSNTTVIKIAANKQADLIAELLFSKYLQEEIVVNEHSGFLEEACARCYNRYTEYRNWAAIDITQPVQLVRREV